MDHEGTLKGQGSKECVFYVQKKRQIMGEQIMAPLPARAMGSSPFLSTALDLFGPLSLAGLVNKRPLGRRGG
jgi:hypothetical protein